MKIPCGGCGKYTPGDHYDPSMGCFFCWSAKHSSKYQDYWEDANKIQAPAPAAVAQSPSRVSYEPGYNPYQRAAQGQPASSVSVPSAPVQPAPAPATITLQVAPQVCAHLGGENGMVTCPTCSGNVQLKTFACAVHGSCTRSKKAEDVACCVKCPDFKLKEG